VNQRASSSSRLSTVIVGSAASAMQPSMSEYGQGLQRSELDHSGMSVRG
jgi:hypothetical protein